ncbi:hypothetical protein BsWGS_14210 [Bradybaena similaris]
MNRVAFVGRPLGVLDEMGNLCENFRDTFAGNNGRVNPFPSSDIAKVDEPDFSSWSNLMASIPKDERRASQIRRHQLVISVPVCVVGKENPVTFTSMDAIEQTLRRLYPEVLVKKGPSQEAENMLEMLDANDNHIELVNSKQTITAESKKDRRVSVVTLSEHRKMSINSCITSMRKNAEDYQRQLKGVKSVGLFAEEESLKVLFAKSDAIQCVIDAMKSFPEKEELQHDACLSLLKMASASESNCVHILQHDGVSAISAAMRHHSENTEIVKLLFRTVAFISTAVDLASQLVAGGLHSDIFSAMSRHASNIEIVREGCFIIGNLLVTVEAVHQVMLVGGVHTIINMVEMFPDDEKILENACRTLGSFAIYDETCQDIASAGATSTVLMAMQSPNANVTVAECGCWALASLTAIDSTCEEIVRLESISVILDALREYPREENLQEYGTRVLYNMSSCETTVEFVCSESVIVLLQSALVNFPDSVELLEIVLITISQVMMDKGNMYRHLAESRCVHEIIKVMMNLPENQLIQEHGCKIIGNMAVHDDLRKLVEAAGASKAVISAMLTLDSVADIQEVGCLALMNLTADSKDNKVRIKNAGAVPSLLNTLREFSRDTNIVLCALKALGNLVSLEEVCHLLLDEHGLETIVSLVSTHGNQPDILVFIAMVLCGVTELPDLKEEEAALIDQTLMGISSSIQSNPDVSLYVCQAIENLVKTDVGRITFMKENRMGVILSAMNTFTDNPNIHRCCCKVIAVVTLYVDTKKRLITETTLKSVLKSMELFPMDVELQIIGCGTISCMVEKIALLKHELIGQGGVSIISRSIGSHHSEPRLAVVALLALSHVVPMDTRTYPDEAKTVFEDIMLCMKTFPENKEIQISACNILCQCQLTDENDVHELVQNATSAARRYASEQEVQKAVAAVLKPYHEQGKFMEYIDMALNSPAISTKELFGEKLVKEQEQS